MKKILIGILLLLIIGINGIFASEEKTTVRVGISSSDFSTFEHSEAEFTSLGIYNVTDIPSGQKIEFSSNDIANFKYSNGVFAVSSNDEIKAQDLKGPLVLTSADKIGIKGIKRKGDTAFYHGMIELKPTRRDKFNIINILSLQNYLKGVVPNEMPVAFGLEALKAQAVAARNYVNRPNGSYSNYDVCDSTACQVYYGANGQTEISDRAVDETLGIYAMYDNEIILALYSSTASGITENYFNTFGDEIEDKPYLKSVRDTDKLSRLNEEEYFKTNPPSFDMDSPKYRWVVEFERGELENILSKTLFEQTKTRSVFPAFEKDKKIEGIEDIKILKKGVSKKALVVEIKSNSGNYTVVKELPIRRVFKKDNKILPSANFIVEKIEDKKK